jgi:hypothetical protein
LVVAAAAVEMQVDAQGVDCAIESRKWTYFQEVVLSVDDGGYPAEQSDCHDFVGFVVGNSLALAVAAEEVVAVGCCNPRERIVVAVAAGGSRRERCNADHAADIEAAAVVAGGVVAPEEEVHHYFHEIEKDFELENVA